MIQAVIIAAVSAIASGVVTLLFERRKEKREDRLEAKKRQREVFQNRPEMQVVDFKDYTPRPGYGIKKKCDVELFVAHIDHVVVEGQQKRDAVHAFYKEDHWNSDEWCCVLYTFKNAGKTDISTTHFIWNIQRSACVFPADEVRQWGKANLLNYSFCYDRKIRVGETVSLKLYYHRDAKISGLFSAAISIGMIDDDGYHWTQALFAPQDKLYDSRTISPTEYTEAIRTDLAEECFKKPWLW